MHTPVFRCLAEKLILGKPLFERRIIGIAATLVPTRRSPPQRRLAVLVLRVDVGLAIIEQQSHYSLMPPFRSLRQWRLACLVETSYASLRQQTNDEVEMHRSNEKSLNRRWSAFGVRKAITACSFL